MRTNARADSVIKPLQTQTTANITTTQPPSCSSGGPQTSHPSVREPDDGRSASRVLCHALQGKAVMYPQGCLFFMSYSKLCYSKHIVYV